MTKELKCSGCGHGIIAIQGEYDRYGNQMYRHYTKENGETISCYADADCDCGEARI